MGPLRRRSRFSRRAAPPRRTVEDAEAIRSIYNVEVQTSTVTFDIMPRSLEEQQEWIANRSGAHAVVVAIDDDDEVVGFGSLSPYKARPAYATTVEDSVYVHRDHQGEGVGRSVLAELIRLADEHGFHAIMARIVGDHATSIGLHSSQASTSSGASARSVGSSAGGSTSSSCSACSDARGTRRRSELAADGSSRTPRASGTGASFSGGPGRIRTVEGDAGRLTALAPFVRSGADPLGRTR